MENLAGSSTDTVMDARHEKTDTLMNEPNDNLLHSTLPAARANDAPRNSPRRSFLRRLPGYVLRSVIAAVGMCMVILMTLIVLPLVPFDRGHR